MPHDAIDHPASPRVITTIGLTAAAMFAFAANSLLCRMALLDDAIDPARFTGIRLVSGAAALALIIRLRVRSCLTDRSGLRRPESTTRFVGLHRRFAEESPASPSSLEADSDLLGPAPIRQTGPSRHADPSGASRPRPLAAAMLFLYAAAFSFAYVELEAGTGALLLFGTVQVTMFTASIRSGVRPRPAEWAGLAIASAGLAILVAPGLRAPDPKAAGLMVFAGIGWGLYSLLGRGQGDPIRRTALSFAWSVPPALLLLVLHQLFGRSEWSPAGVTLAIVSGVITSGLGYVIWYAALAGLTTVRAALVQLSVPIIASVVAIPVLDEPLTPRLVIAGVMVIGGVAAAILTRR